MPDSWFALRLDIGDVAEERGFETDAAITPASIARGSSRTLLRHRLKIVEIGHCPLRMRGCRKEEPFLILQDREPGSNLARVIRSWFQLRHDIGAQENGAPSSVTYPDSPA
jgi:hypothetical protein